MLHIKEISMCKTMRGIISHYSKPLIIYKSFKLYCKLDNLIFDPVMIMPIPIFLTKRKYKLDFFCPCPISMSYTLTCQLGFLNTCKLDRNRYTGLPELRKEKGEDTHHLSCLKYPPPPLLICYCKNLRLARVPVP